jgi:hemerythrin-like domain-containing protein
MANLCTQHLMDEHREIEAVLAKLELFLDGLRAGSAWEQPQRETFTDIFHFLSHRVGSHIVKEHHILFPALEGHLPPHEGPLDVLRNEHVVLESQILRLRESGQLIAGGAAEQAVVQDFVRAGKALIRVCRDHIYKEDRILFPMVARLLPGETDAQLLAEMQSLHGRPKSSASGVE